MRTGETAAATSQRTSASAGEPRDGEIRVATWQRTDGRWEFRVERYDVDRKGYLTNTWNLANNASGHGHGVKNTREEAEEQGWVLGRKLVEDRELQAEATLLRNAATYTYEDELL